MDFKYESLDGELLTWLARKKEQITTTIAVQALRLTDSTEKRHIARRFSQLEERGALVCELQGTTRVCYVAGVLPHTFYWKKAQAPKPEPVNQNIIASNSEEFLAAGGTIERLSAAWENRGLSVPAGSLPMGEGYALPFFGVDSFD